MNKFFHLAKNIAVSNFAELKRPYRITYILTHKCQLRCKMCNIWSKSPGKELSLEQIRRFFSQSNGFSWINLSGGEIFLREDLMDIIDTIFKHCRRLYLLDFPTNGFQPDLVERNVQKIISLYHPPKLLVTVSLDGTPEEHDRIRGMGGAWEKAVETFRRLRGLRSRGFDVFLGMTLQAANEDKFQETFASVDKRIGGLSYNDFHINIVQQSAHYYNNDSAGQPDRQRLWDSLNFINRQRKSSMTNPVAFLEQRYQLLARAYLDTGKIPVGCQALGASFFMAPDGTVYPCSIYNKPIGNIADSGYDINKLWNTSARAGLRKEIRQGNCPQCWTPCEAYQSILANILRLAVRGVRLAVEKNRKPQTANREP
ncbi:MAG: radical SAM protein [Candidatus Omnitrophota bacterium]